MAKRPSFQFYPSDWRQDLALQRCSLEAQGLLINLICLLHEGKPYGYLRDDRSPISTHQCAHLLGIHVTRYIRLSGELIQGGILSVDDQGVIYSKRMVKDEQTRASRALGGYKSINHPNTIKPKKISGKGTLEGYPQGSNAVPPPSSSSSSSSSDIKNISKEKVKKESSKKVLLELPSCLAERDWEEYLAHRKSIQAPMSIIAQRRALHQLEKLHADGQDVAKVIDQSIVNGWKGLFAIKNLTGENQHGNLSRQKSQREKDGEYWERELKAVADAENNGTLKKFIPK